MTTADAIRALRDSIGCSQQDLASRLGVSGKSVSRYENGQEPNDATLHKLAELSGAAGLNHLKELFAAKWKSDVVSRGKKSLSQGAQRRVSMFSLAHWLNLQRNIYEVSTWVLNQGNLEREQALAFHGIRESAGKTYEELAAYTGLGIPLDPTETIKDVSGKSLLGGSLFTPDWMNLLFDSLESRADSSAMAPITLNRESSKAESKPKNVKEGPRKDVKTRSK